MSLDILEGENAHRTLQEPIDDVTRAAHAQIRQEWLDAGMTEEEWERGERAAILLDYMLAAGLPDAEVAQQLENVSQERLARLERRYLPKT